MGRVRVRVNAIYLSNVALISTSLRSARRASNLRRMARRTSLSSARSCTSSMKTCDTPVSSGLPCYVVEVEVVDVEGVVVEVVK